MNYELLILPGLLLGVGGLVVRILVRDAALKRQYARCPYQIGYVGTMRGTLIRHWEVGRFVWDNGIIQGQKWGNPGNCCQIVNLDEMGLEEVDVWKGGTQPVEFVGEIVGIGRFGHMDLAMFQVRFVSMVAGGS